MADNVVLNSGSGGVTAAADDIGGGVYAQRVKPVIGADGTGVDVIPVSAGLDTTATGAPAVGIIGQFDDVATSAVTENQFAPIRISTRRALLVEGVASGTAVPVSAASLPLPTGAATSAKQDTIIGHVDGIEALLASVGVVGGGVEATAQRVTIATDSTGVLSVDDNGGNLSIDDGGNSITVDGTVAVTNSDLTTIAALSKAEDASHSTGNTGVMALAVRNATVTDLSAGNTDGDYEPLQVSANGRLWTSATIDAALPAGTNAIGKLAANSGVDIGDVDVTSLPNVTLAAGTNTNEVVGDVAHDAGVAGNPVLICGAAQDTDDTAPPNRVSAESDATRLAVDRDGSLHVLPYGPQVWTYHDDDVAAVTTDGTVHSAPGANLSLYVTDIVFSIGAATASSIFFEESTTKVLGPWYLEAIAGRSIHVRFGTPKKITANTALLVTNTGAISFSIDVTGFTAQG